MQKIQTEHGIFTNNEITGQTAEEVYAEYLEQIDNCSEPPKTNQELTEENKLLKQQIQALTEANEFQEELIVEMASIVYA